MRPREALALHGSAQDGLATRRQLGVASGTLHRAVTAGELVRVRPGVYACTPLPAWPAWLVGPEGLDRSYLVQVRAVLLSLGPHASASGLTAALLRGWAVLREPVRRVEVTLPRGRRPPSLAGVRGRVSRRPQTELRQVVAGSAPLCITTAVQTVVDCCLDLPHEEAVVVVDSALRSGQVGLAELWAAARQLRHRWARRVRAALIGCDPESGSVLETVLRLAFLQDGVEGWGSQVRLRDVAGRLIGRVDFAFAEARLVVEADGARWHSDLTRDRTRDNRLAAAGWRVLRLTWHQVVERPDEVLALVRDALDAGRDDGRSGREALLTAA